MDDAAALFSWVENEWMLYCSWMDFDVMIKTVFNQYSRVGTKLYQFTLSIPQSTFAI